MHKKRTALPFSVKLLFAIFFFYFIFLSYHYFIFLSYYFRIKWCTTPSAPDFPLLFLLVLSLPAVLLLCLNEPS